MGNTKKKQPFLFPDGFDWWDVLGLLSLGLAWGAIFFYFLNH